MKKTKNFGLIGASGYVAPKHMHSIREVNGNLVVAYDINDSVGIIDSYFPDANFFTNQKKFNKFLEEFKHIDYLSICSPNHLHFSHIKFGLENKCNIICEKPLVINLSDLDTLEKLEKKFNKKISTILQLRLHPEIIKLKNRVLEENEDYEVELTYITSRGKWYFVSWKGDEKKSGGISTNIGIHFFDLLCYLFGKIKKSYVHLREKNKCGGHIIFERAKVKWFLSIDREDLPKTAQQKPYRSLLINKKKIDLSENFNELHVKSFKNIIEEKGFTIDDVRPSIELVSNINSSKIEVSRENIHPYLKKI